jgi:hypothetical protein
MAAADDPEERVRTGMEHLQAAAREMIQATRSLLDAAEELVDDPAAVQGLVGSLGSLAQAAAERLRGEHTEGDSGDDDGSIQRIPLS